MRCFFLVADRFRSAIFFLTTENSRERIFETRHRRATGAPLVRRVEFPNTQHGTFLSKESIVVTFRGRLFLLLTSTGAVARGDTHAVRVGSPRRVDRMARRAPVARSRPLGRQPPRARTGGRRVASSDAPRVRGAVERGGRPFGAGTRARATHRAYRLAARARATATDRVAARDASPARPPRTIANRRRPPLRFLKPRRAARTRRRAWTRASGRWRFPRSRLCSWTPSWAPWIPRSWGASRAKAPPPRSAASPCPPPCSTFRSSSSTSSPSSPARWWRRRSPPPPRSARPRPKRATARKRRPRRRRWKSAPAAPPPPRRCAAR